MSDSPFFELPQADFENRLSAFAEMCNEAELAWIAVGGKAIAWNGIDCQLVEYSENRQDIVYCGNVSGGREEDAFQAALLGACDTEYLPDLIADGPSWVRTALAAWTFYDIWATRRTVYEDYLNVVYESQLRAEQLEEMTV